MVILLGEPKGHCWKDPNFHQVQIVLPMSWNWELPTSNVCAENELASSRKTTHFVLGNMIVNHIIIGTKVLDYKNLMNRKSEKSAWLLWIPRLTTHDCSWKNIHDPRTLIDIVNETWKIVDDSWNFHQSRISVDTLWNMNDSLDNNIIQWIIHVS